MKTRLFALTAAGVAALALGYVFLLGLLLGVLASHYLAGRSQGRDGRLNSIIVRFSRWQLHIHHWLYATWLIALSLATGVHFLSPAITYGILGGLAFQGLYQYNDWHLIVIGRRSGRSRKAALPLAPAGSDDPDHVLGADTGAVPAQDAP